MDLGLEGKLIVVTGGGSGIGEAVSRACLSEQARVVVVSRLTSQVRQFVSEMEAGRLPCEFVEAELANGDHCRRAIDHVQSTYGQLDGLVNNAGANDDIGLETGDPARFLNSLQQNLTHYYAMAHYGLPMLKQARGAIVNVSSKVALTGQGGTSAYAAAKGAQLALTRDWAAELLPYGIRVNSVVPAEVLTPLYGQWLQTREDPEAELRKIAHRVPLGGRMTTPAEIAATTVFLLSNTQSGHTTGQHLVVDGGYTHLDRALT